MGSLFGKIRLFIFALFGSAIVPLMIAMMIGIIKDELASIYNPGLIQEWAWINVSVWFIWLLFLSRKNDGFYAARAILRPCWRFIRAYIFKLGFLDGYPGFYIAHATAFGAFVRYSR
ncbi:MAG: hypothetical protein WCI27_03575, partial [Candidatus Omnitrophota bacterium]